MSQEEAKYKDPQQEEAMNSGYRATNLKRWHAPDSG
jgi:hypothetical protein